MSDVSVKLNEILNDAEGPDTGLEWIELYNTGTATVNLDGLVSKKGLE